MPSLAPSDPLGEYDPVVDRDVAGYELVDELYLLVIEDPFEESFGHNLVLLYSHGKISLLPSYRRLTSDGAPCLFISLLVENPLQLLLRRFRSNPPEGVGTVRGDRATGLQWVHPLLVSPRQVGLVPAPVGVWGRPDQILRRHTLWTE